MNSRDRKSKYLLQSAVFNIVEAVDHAATIRLPLNTFVSISFTDAWVDHRADAFRQDYLTVVRQWLRSRIGIPITNVWTVENKGGLHVHLLLHIPVHLHPEFEADQKRLIMSAGAGRWTKWVVNVQFLVADYTTNITDRTRYLVKGTDPETCRIIGREHEPQGIVTGKRAGTSENIGRRARSRLRSASVRTVMPIIRRRMMLNRWSRRR